MRTYDHTTNVLGLLTTDADLAAWKLAISKWQDVHVRQRRAARRRDPSLEKTQKALRCGPPSNIADLARITVAVLKSLGTFIRNSETSDRRRYWHKDPESGKPRKPQHENDCRDALLSDLNEMLNKYQIDAQPEGRYADDARADIHLSYDTQFATTYRKQEIFTRRNMARNH